MTPSSSSRLPRPAPIIDTRLRWHGTVVRIKRDKGFGFILADPPGRSDDPDAQPLDLDAPKEEFFFHLSALTGGVDTFDILEEGDQVEFQAMSSSKGARAYRVTKL